MRSSPPRGSKSGSKRPGTGQSDGSSSEIRIPQRGQRQIATGECPENAIHLRELDERQDPFRGIAEHDTTESLHLFGQCDKEPEGNTAEMIQGGQVENEPEESRPDQFLNLWMEILHRARVEIPGQSDDHDPPVIIDLKTAGIGGAAAHHTLHRAATNLISGRVILIHSHVRAGYNGGIASAESRR